MSIWLWVNLSLGALFVLAIVGIPVWMVLRRPDIGPDAASPATVRPAHALAREATAQLSRAARWQAAAATLAGARRQSTAERPGGQRIRPELDWD